MYFRFVDDVMFSHNGRVIPTELCSAIKTRSTVLIVSCVPGRNLQSTI